jgi:hypothetical protein
MTRAGLLLVLLSALLSGTAAAQSPAGKALYRWEQARDGTRHYLVEGLQIRLATTKRNGVDVAELTASGPGAKPLVITAEEGGLSPRAHFDVFAIDPRHSRKDVMFAYYTGGAHCCAVTMVASLLGDEWKVTQVEYTDGDLPETRPIDGDGDGQVDFVSRDDRFLYAFSSYAESRAPRRVVNVENGRMVDRSADPAFAALHRADMQSFEPDCLRSHNSACAAFVASAARIGEIERAWAVMLRHHDRNAAWDMQLCDPGAAGCANPRKTRNFPEALGNLLIRAGYAG